MLAIFNTTMNSNYLHRSNQQGSTLLEVLITMLITAIALLGLAGVQVRAQQEHRIAHLRLIAVEKGNQLLEEARNAYRLSRDGNTAFIMQPGFTNTLPTQNCGLNIAAGAGIGGATGGSNCSMLQMWESMRSFWLSDLSAKLPNPAVLLTHTPDVDAVGATAAGLTSATRTLAVAPHPVLTVTIAWLEPQLNSTAVDTNCGLAGNSTFTNSTVGYRCIFLTTNL